MKAETKKIILPQTVFDITVEKETENETSLPDYMPDINRLIRVEEQPRIESAEISGDKANINGRAFFNVLYESDYKGKIYQAVFSTGFEQKFDLTSQNYRYGAPEEEAEYTGDVITEYSAAPTFVGCKLLSPRKLLLKSRDNVRFCAKRCCSYETPDKDRSAVPTFYKTEKIASRTFRQPIEREYALTETIELTSDEPAIGDIVYTNVMLSAPEVTNEDGRALINTDAFIKTLYESEDGTDYYSKTDVIPLSLTVDDNVLSPESITFIKLWVPETTSEKLPDAYGEPRNINVSFTVKALISVLEEREEEPVTDVFSPGYDYELAKSKITYEETEEISKSSFSLEKTFETADNEIGTILDCSVSLNAAECAYENGDITVKGSADISLLVKNAAGEPKISALDFSVPFTETFKSSAPDGTVFTVSVLPSAVSAKAAGKTRINVKANADAVLCGVRKQTKEIITSAAFSPALPKESDGKLVICYPSPNDTLWDISKRYSASPSDIAACNAGAFDDTETVSKGTKIIVIPAVTAK